MKSFYGWRWLSIVIGLAVIAGLVVLVARAAQHRIEQPRLESIAAQPIYDADGKLTAFPLTLRFRITERRLDDVKPKSWVQTVELDLVAQERMTMALDGNTVEFAAVRDDIFEVAGALYRSQHPPALPQMQRKAIRGEVRK